jgi:multidrug efflux pump subunit AcrB
MGKDGFTAAREGNRRNHLRGLAATAAVIAIFLPVVFMEGVVGRYFFQFGVTLSVAVAFYVEAVTLARHVARAFRDAARCRAVTPRAFVDRAFRAFRRCTRARSRAALRHPWKVLAVSTA